MLGQAQTPLCLSGALQVFSSHVGLFNTTQHREPFPSLDMAASPSSYTVP